MFSRSLLFHLMFKCVVCGSDLQRGYSGECLSSSILFKYDSSRGH